MLDGVMLDDLGGAAAQPDLGAEIDAELDRGPARLGKMLGRDDRADADIDPAKIIVGDWRSRRLGRLLVAHASTLDARWPKEKAAALGGAQRPSSGSLDLGGRARGRLIGSLGSPSRG